MNSIFVSHANEDREITSQIAETLQRTGIRTWISFRDIAPGAHWDESIEAALKAAKALAVVVTASSVQSRYVRAEVEAAITANKTVVPIVVDESEMPLRWQTLQHIKWADGGMAAAEAIASVLPERASSALAMALGDESQFDTVRRLVLSHPEWLPMESYMSRWYTFRTDAALTEGSSIDCFAARLDTPGPRAILVYLTSPYHSPFSRSGGARPHLRRTMATLRDHVARLSSDMPSDHPLFPPVLFAPEAHAWKYIVHRFTGLRVYVIAGRRTHYQGAQLNVRNRFIAKTTVDLFPHDRHCLSGFEVLSYDRVLEAALRPSSINSGAQEWIDRTTFLLP